MTSTTPPPDGADARAPAVRLERVPGAVRAVLARPERQNGISAELLRGLHRALDETESDPERPALLVEGSDGVFCTGMDFADAGDGSRDTGETGGAEFWRLLERFTTTPAVVVSLVDGKAIGGGVGIVAASDFVWATPRSSFGLPEALWGLLPCCVLPFLIRRVGFQPAYAMTLSTLPVSADEAVRSRLVDEVAEYPEAALRRLLLRLRRIDTDTVESLKRYVRPMSPIGTERGSAAVAEFVRLFTSTAVAERIEEYNRTGRFPWERSET
ncbi:polyketide biosynthesis enoyl-CoA hydratase PksH [Actinopolyspora lacussalsi]|nr:polyketide biosynthesis enoyl-CoA hydratase PksH [Actinopolyspora lacussalsi]